MATKEELLFEAARRGLLTGERKTAFEEAVRRGILVPPTIPQEELDARTPLEQAGSTVGETVGGTLENLGSFASGMVAEPIAGIAGIAQSLNPFAEEGAGKEAVKATRDLLTTKPKTLSGKRQQSGLGETLRPVGEAIKGTQEFLGDKAFEVTGSPAISAAAETLPIAALELLGLKGSKRFTSGITKQPTKRAVRTAVVESAPEVAKLKDTARQVFKEIDDSGVRIKQQAFDKLIDGIEKQTKRAGLSSRVTKQAAGALAELKKSKGVSQTLTEVDTLRNIAKGVAKSTDKVEASLGNVMINNLDDFLNNAKRSDFVGGSQSAAQTAKQFKAARGLWGRAARAETIDEAIKVGTGRASGAESGIRNELNRILNSKKKAQFFPKSELAAMRKVVEGNFSQNLTRLIGKLGMSLDRAPGTFQALVASGSAGLGGALGLGAGGLAIPVIGTISKKIAKGLTTGKAEFLSTMSKAGTDAEKIAKAYLSVVPKAKRSVSDLADLLSDPKIDLTTLETIATRTIQDAMELAKGKQQLNLAAAAAAGATPQALNEGN